MDSTQVIQDIQEWFAAAGISAEVIFSGDLHRCPNCRDTDELAA